VSKDAVNPVASLTAMRLIPPLLVVLGLVVLAFADTGTADAPRAPRYVSLGDSLAASVQPDATGHDRPTADGFSERVWHARAAVTPGLQLVKLGRGGETSATMISSPKPGPSQLQLAEQELHKGSVALVTIDIGANEVERCARTTDFDQACVQQGLASLRASLPKIIGRLRAAGGSGLVIIGVNYYNSFLGRWVTGPDGRSLARASVPVERSINATLADVYERLHVPVADVETSFQTDAMDRYVNTGSYGRVPLAVERTCHWTWACSARYDDHTNTLGYRVIARTVLALLRSH
jgi:lysophospholipase L1-like esterase